MEPRPARLVHQEHIGQTLERTAEVVRVEHMGGVRALSGLVRRDADAAREDDAAASAVGVEGRMEDRGAPAWILLDGDEDG